MQIFWLIHAQLSQAPSERRVGVSRASKAATTLAKSVPFSGGQGLPGVSSACAVAVASRDSASALELVDRCAGCWLVHLGWEQRPHSVASWRMRLTMARPWAVHPFTLAQIKILFGSPTPNLKQNTYKFHPPGNYASNPCPRNIIAIKRYV